MSDAFKRAKGALTEAARKEAMLELRGRITEADQIDPTAVYSLFRRLIIKGLG
jgi:chorismate mutase